MSCEDENLISIIVKIVICLNFLSNVIFVYEIAFK